MFSFIRSSFTMRWIEVKEERNICRTIYKKCLSKDTLPYTTVYMAMWWTDIIVF